MFLILEKPRNSSLVDPADQKDIPRPRIGYFGVIDERLDAGASAKIGGSRPDLHFVMLGPVVKIDPASLTHFKTCIGWDKSSMRSYPII